MNRRLVSGALLAALTDPLGRARGEARTSGVVPLPRARLDGTVSVERALKRRRSVREFRPHPLTLAQVSQLLWAAQGVTGEGGKRTAPSAGALHPLTIYLAAGRAPELAAGLYRYEPSRHALERIGGGDRRAELAAAAAQDWVGRAAAVLVIAADSKRAEGKYGARGARFVAIEVGHVAQNVSLQAVALGLAATDVGAFDPAGVKAAAGLKAVEEPLLLLPVGLAAR